MLNALRSEAYGSIQTESHPRKWISEALAPNLHDDEDILEYDIELVEDD